MISKDSLHIDWITRASLANKKADKILVEKVIRALMLVEGLALQNLDFVFKGGTALMLILDSSKRLSIDIDIIIEKEPKNLEDAFMSLLEGQGFTRFEPQERKTQSSIHKAHYKFFYHPIYKTHATEESILLDIVFEKVGYSNVKSTEITSHFVITDGAPVPIRVPSVEDMLGDKLTAYAPHSTGIPYFAGETSMGMEIMKQLYDIGNLIDMASDGAIVRKTFERIAISQLKYRNQSKLTIKDVLEDIYQTSLCLVSRGVDGKGDFNHLQTGIQRISRFIFSETFHIEKAIAFASKAAYVAALIRNEKTELEKFKSPTILTDWVIGDPYWPRLNRLKKSNPEAFFYWYKIYRLTTDKN